MRNKVRQKEPVCSSSSNKVRGQSKPCSDCCESNLTLCGGLSSHLHVAEV